MHSPPLAINVQFRNFNYPFTVQETVINKNIVRFNLTPNSPGSRQLVKASELIIQYETPRHQFITTNHFVNTSELLFNSFIQALITAGLIDGNTRF